MDIAKRSHISYKGHLTRAIKNADQLLKATTVDKGEVERTIDRLVLKWNNYEDSYNKLETLLLQTDVKDDVLEEMQNEFYNYEAEYQDRIVKLRSSVTSNPDHTSSNKNNQDTGTEVVKPKLPCIKIPVFSGEITEYESFIDQFQAQIGNRKDLEQVTKLQYLKSHLKGRALELIEGYSSITANYQNALDTLKDTYGDEERIKHCLLHKIVNLNSPKHTKSDLETFRISMLNLTRSISNKHDYTCCEWIISSLFQHKLPSMTIRQLYIKYDTNYFSLDQMNEGIRDLVSHMETENQGKASNSKVIQSKSSDQPAQNIGTYYQTQSSNKPKQHTDPLCRFCGAGHRNSQCTKYATGTDRIQRLRELKLCIRCMGNHPGKPCNTKLQICRRCQRGVHHTSLCKYYDKCNQQNTRSVNVSATDNTPQSSQKNPNTSNVAHIKVTASSTTSAFCGVALSTGLAKLKHKGNEWNVRLFFDSGSQKSFITRELANQIKLPVKMSAKMTLTGFMGNPVTQTYDIVRPIIKMGNRIKRIFAVVVDKIPQAIDTAGLTGAMEHLSRLGVKLADTIPLNDNVGPVSLLIGADHYYDFIGNVIVQEGIHLLKTPSGYIPTGIIPAKYHTMNMQSQDTPTIVPESVIVMRITDQVDPLTEVKTHLEEECEVHKLWDLDIMGINNTEPMPDDRRSYELYLDSLKYEDKQYWVRLPWKLNKPDLPNNYSRAMGQMYSLVKELKKKDKLETYQKILYEQLDSSFIEEVPEAQPHDQCHYLPHHAVHKDSVTTPVRIVFNCSSRANKISPSLNDCLMTGPPLTSKLYDVLLKFRINPYAYTADISKAFLRIGLQEEDRNYTRFLWPSDVNDLSSPVKTFRFKSVLFGATSSPFLLQATIDFHLRNSESPIKETLASNFYVDNFQGTVANHEQLKIIYEEANKELQQANMPLRQWATNNQEINSIIERDFPGYKTPDSTSILGITWNIKEDSLKLKSPNYAKTTTKIITKRQLLAKVSKLFDPLGIITPVTIKGRLLVQEAWKLQVDWDDPLPEFYVEEWKELEAEFQQLSNLEIPRITASDTTPSTLHIFCDASAKAYGAAAYVVNESRSKLLTSKARVAPLKTKTIPQLELTALLVGTRLGVHVNHVLGNLTINKTYIWSDNESCLQWLRNDNSKIPYVKNRVAEIKDIQKDFVFMHVDTKNNPADMLSRGVKAQKLESLWFNGPEWLVDPKLWPTQKSYVVSNIHLLDTPTQKISESTQLIDPSKFSSLNMLLGVTRRVMDFIKILFRKRGWNRQLKIGSPMTYWIKQLQGEVYKEELQTLSRNESKLHTETSKKILRTNNFLINRLGLFLDDNGLIRCRGRIHHSSLNYSSKHPVLLPKNCWFTDLVIIDCHHTTLHGGIAETLLTIRKQFWIPKARQAIKKCLRKCVICKRYDSRKIQYPAPPPLPDERVQLSEPFNVVGVDYTGAIQLQEPDGKEQSPTKVYICLFTCANTRAVHLELVMDISTSSFLRALRRFIGRRSCPSIIISDNGSNFRAAEPFIKSIFQSHEVQEFLEGRQCKWKFIPPKAPWQGGFYERMVGVVKRCMRKVLHNKRVTIDELRTVLVEIEARVNNRPITYVHEDINEIQALTPNHLLQGTTIQVLPPLINNELRKDPDFLLTLPKPTAEKLTARFNYLNKLLTQWQRVWHQDYLTSLREQHRGKKAGSETHLKEGDIVLIDCENQRASWPLGKIVELCPDKYDTLRLVKVLSKGHVSLRTVDKLIPLEISSETSSDRTQNEHVQNQRPKRQAAVKAQDRIKEQTM